MITADQITAARLLLGWRPSRLAARAKITTGMVRRAEGDDGGSGATIEAFVKIQTALERAGVEFIPENGGGAGVRLRMTL